MRVLDFTNERASLAGERLLIRDGLDAVFVSLHDDESLAHPMIGLAMNVAMLGCAHVSRMPLQRSTHSAWPSPAHVAQTESEVHPASF